MGFPREVHRRVDLTVTEPRLIVTKEVCNETRYGVGPACTNFVDLADDGETVLETIVPKLPSGKLKLKPREPFQVFAGESLLVQIDIDAEKSIKYDEKGNGEWQFRPVCSSLSRPAACVCQQRSWLFSEWIRP